MKFEGCQAASRRGRGGEGASGTFLDCSLENRGWDSCNLRDINLRPVDLPNIAMPNIDLTINALHNIDLRNIALRNTNRGNIHLRGVTLKDGERCRPVWTAYSCRRG